MTASFEVAVGDVVQLRKVHPCGSVTWVVTRIGADIGIKCQTCGRHVMLTRREFFKSTKKVLSHTTEPQPTQDSHDVQPG